MQLPFFNGLIWGTLIGGAGLVVLSLSQDILNLQGLDPEVTVLPVGQSPDMATASEVTVIDLDPPLENSAPPAVVSQAPTAASLGRSFTLSAQKPVLSGEMETLATLPMVQKRRPSTNMPQVYPGDSPLLLPQSPTRLAGMRRPSGTVLDDTSAMQVSAPRLLQTDPLPEVTYLRYAQEFEASAGKGLISIVLIDRPFMDPPDWLLDIGMPIAVAIDGKAADARAKMLRYRAAGFEIFTNMHLPETLTSVNMALIADASVQAVPMATGLWPSENDHGPRSPAQLRLLQDYLAKENLGFLPKADLKISVEMSRASDVLSALDVAAQKAVQTGHAIVALDPPAETWDVLRFWLLHSDRGDSVIAPLSAVLTR
tara:strand:- start:560 stop:1669 length:1110 start_codon:yes stop_codon:yes gene_type:complete